MTTLCQRWEGGRHSWRHPDDGGFDAGRYDVEPISTPMARDFVVTHHYSRAFVADVQRYGLFDDGRLVGVSVLSMPAGPKVLDGCFPGLARGEALELGRFVLLDEVPANGESWFLGRCWRQAAAAGIAGVVSFSDPVPRTNADGSVTFPGHLGTIYQATNATFTGRAWPRTMVLLRDGTIFSPRAMTKVRLGDRGHEYAERQLVGEGARPLREGEDRKRWLAEALDDVGARRLRHPGNLRYAFAIGPPPSARPHRLRLPALPEGASGMTTLKAPPDAPMQTGMGSWSPWTKFFVALVTVCLVLIGVAGLLWGNPGDTPDHDRTTCADVYRQHRRNAAENGYAPEDRDSFIERCEDGDRDLGDAVLD